MQLTLKGNRQQLLNTFESCLRSSGGIRSNSIIQLRIFYDRVEFHAKGVCISVAADNVAEGDVLCPAKLLKSYLSSSSASVIVFVFSKGEVQCGSSKFQISSIDVFPHGLEPSSEIAINATLKSIKRLTLQESNTKYYQQKGMMSTVVAANKQLKDDLTKALEILQGYNVTYDDLEELVRKRIG